MGEHYLPAYEIPTVLAARQCGAQFDQRNFPNYRRHFYPTSEYSRASGEHDRRVFRIGDLPGFVPDISFVAGLLFGPGTDQIHWRGIGAAGLFFHPDVAHYLGGAGGAAGAGHVVPGAAWTV